MHSKKQKPNTIIIAAIIESVIIGIGIYFYMKTKDTTYLIGAMVIGSVIITLGVMKYKKKKTTISQSQSASYSAPIENQPIDPPYKTKDKKKANVLIFIMPLVGIIFFIGMFFGIRNMVKTEIKGTIISENNSLGTWKIFPDSCDSGQRQGFFGVDIYNKKNADIRLRAIKDPVKGIIVLVKSSKTEEQGMKLTPSDCKKLQLKVRHGNVTYNKIREMKGHLTMDCKLITADLTFNGCF